MTIEFDGQNNKLGTTTADSVTIKTNDTDAITVDSSQKIGIGTSSPSSFVESSRFVVGSGTSGVNEMMFLYSGTDTFGALGFADGTSSNNRYRGMIGYDHNTDAMFISTAGGGSASRDVTVDSSGNVGIGTSSPSAKLHLDQSSNTETEIRASAATVYTKIKANDIGGFSAIDFSHSLRFVDGSGNTKATVTSSSVNTFANLNVNGTLAKDSGSFRISHPLTSKNATHYLVHSFVESPQANNIYRGKVDLINGTATVNLDTVSSMTEGTFVALNRDIHIYTTNETDWDAVKGSVSGNTLTINCQDNTSTATVSWLVIGERQDQHMMDTDWTDDNGRVIVERLKETE